MFTQTEIARTAITQARHCLSTVPTCYRGRAHLAVTIEQMDEMVRRIGQLPEKLEQVRLTQKSHMRAHH